MVSIKKRDWANCIAYLNLLSGEKYKCGLGFDVEEVLETKSDCLKVASHAVFDLAVSYTYRYIHKVEKLKALSWNIGPRWAA